MGLDFSDSKSFHTKIVWRTIISNQKNLDPNYFPTHFFFPSSIFSYQNVFQTNKKIRAKLFWNQKNFRTKLSQTTNFTGQKTLYQHLFLPNFFPNQEFFPTKNISDYTVFLINLIGCDIKVNSPCWYSKLGPLHYCKQFQIPSSFTENTFVPCSLMHMVLYLFLD